MRASRTWRIDTVAVLLGTVLLALPAWQGGAAAQDWKMDGKLLGELKKDGTVGSLDDDDYNKAENVSGIACDRATGFPRLCVIVDDESQGAQILMLTQSEGVVGQFIPLEKDVYRRPGGRLKALDFDGEGVAYERRKEGDTFQDTFYVMGSHGRPRHEDKKPDDPAEQDAKAQASRRLFRITLQPGAVDAAGRVAASALRIDETPALNAAIAAHPKLSAVSNAALAKDGLTVEGVAVQGDRLLAGLRAPVGADGEAYLLSVPLASLFRADGQSGDGSGSTLVGLHLGKDTRDMPRGIRDLVAFDGGLLVIAGPRIDPEGDKVAAGDYALYRYDGKTPAKLRDLPSYGTGVKPEALVPFEVKDGELEALLLFDGPEEGGGRLLELDTK